MGALATWLLGLFGTAVGYSALRFAAWKLVIWTMMITVLPIIFSKLIYEIIQGAIDISSSAVTDSGLAAQIFQLTGLAGWLAVQLKIAEGIAVIMSAVMFRMAIRMIPFVRL